MLSCGTTDTIRYDGRTDGASIANSEPLLKVISGANIVHVDMLQRITTIRSTEALSEGYYLSHDRSNAEESAVIKLSNSSQGPVYIADILEGSPKINHGLVKVSPERDLELDKRYTEATID